jgi:hypothetical protein
MKKNYLLIALLALVFTACTKQEMEDLHVSESSAVYKSTETMVILHQADLQYVYTPFSGYKAVGFVKVKNVAYSKQVAVRFTLDNGQTWRDTEATYFTTLDDGYEIWSFETEAAPLSRYNMPTIEFAIRYLVEGNEYWDNNNNQNYSMRGVIGTEYAYDFILGDETKVDGKVELRKGFDGFHIFFWAYVQDIAYQKEVTLVYSLDGWQTVHELPGYYSAENPGQSNVDIWKGSELIHGFIYGTSQVEAAIRYRVNGQEHWDNNFKQNYHPVW